MIKIAIIIGLSGLVTLFVAYIIVKLVSVLTKKPEEKKAINKLIVEGNIVYSRTKYGYEFWYKNGRIVRMKKGDNEWELNPVSDHLEPVKK